MLALCDFVTPNESEAEGLTGIAVDRRRRCRTRRRRAAGPRRGAAIITLGENGALLQATVRADACTCLDT
jgi:ribokinase